MALMNQTENSSPILQRRPQTSYGERTSVHLVRPKTAQHVLPCKNMSRNNINIARFYDWSDDLDSCVSVTTMYRDIACLSAVNADVNKHTGVQWCTNGVRLTPGRMFSRDKNALTKGEREIINGIYRNRGGPKEHGSTRNIKSHQDAWLAGRQLGRASMRRAEASECGSLDSSRTTRDGASTSWRSVECTSTDLQGRLVKSATSRAISSGGYYYVKGRCPVPCNDIDIFCNYLGDMPSAPPCSPRQLSNPRLRVPPINNGQGATLIEEDDTEVNPSSRKVKMDVFLPRITPENMDDDSEEVLSENSKTQPEPEPERVQQTNNKVCEQKVPTYSYTNRYKRDSYETPMHFSSPMYLYHRRKDDSVRLNISE